MAEISQLTEYLYEDSAEVRIHGLREIAALIHFRANEVPVADMDSILRIMLRLLSEEKDPSSEESLLVLGILAFIILRGHDGDRSGNEKALSSILKQLETVGIPPHEEIAFFFSGEYISIAVLLISRQPRSTWDPRSESFRSAVRVIANVLTWSDNTQNIELCLRFVKKMCVMEESHEILSDLKFPVIIQGCLRKGVEASLEALYNMSFKREFLLEMALNDFFCIIQDHPLAVRILINAFRLVPESTSLLLGAECTVQVLYAMQRGANSKELFLLLNSVLKRTERIFPDSLRDLLVSLSLKGIELKDPFMLETLLLFSPIDLLEDHGEKLIESILGVALEKNERYVAAVLKVIGHCGVDWKTCLFKDDIERIVFSWLEEKAIEESLDSGNIEKIISALITAKQVDLPPLNHVKPKFMEILSSKNTYSPRTKNRIFTCLYSL